MSLPVECTLIEVRYLVVALHHYRLCQCSSDNAIERKIKSLLPVIILVKKHVKEP